MGKKIALEKLRTMMRDPDIDEKELAPFFVEDAENTNAFSPALGINPDTVDTGGLEAAIAMGFFNRMSKWRRQRRYRKRINANPDLTRIVSEGDSWFQYPLLLDDVIDHLFDDYAIFSLGEAGDLLADMIAADEITGAIEKIRPRIFLISGGGNDMVGDGRLATMLHPYSEGRPPEAYPNSRFTGFLEDIAGQYHHLFQRLLARFPHLKILCHGYDRAIPDNGKWLGEPMNKLKIRPEALQRDILAVLIDRLNETMKNVAAGFNGSVRHVDCRGVVADNRWHDELHPDNEGYEAVAKRFKAVIDSLVRPEGHFITAPPLSPGREKRIAGTADIPRSQYRKLIARRARKLLGADVDLIDEKKRRELETDIARYYEKVHLGADFLPARFLSDGARRASAVCRVRTQTSLGTGFLIASNAFIMTNNHVLPDASTARSSIAEFGFEDNGALIRAAIEPDRLFITDKALDFTIVACEAGALGDIAPVPLLRNPMTVARGDRVNIIQHPRGRKKEIAIHNNQVIFVKDKVIHYRTDTQPGSSGSAVFNNEWDLVALHHAGWSEAGGRATNEGIRIAAIVAHLIRRNSREAETTGALKELLSRLADSSPITGFFDLEGIADMAAREVEVPTFSGTADYADIGFWNIEHFNRSVSDGRVTRVAGVLNRLSLDVVGLVEVQEPALKRLKDKMRSLGDAVDYKVLDVRGSQDLAVLYDRETSRVEMADDIANRHKISIAATTASGRSAFPRPPLFARCQVSDGNALAVAFIMIIIHLKAFGDAQSRARRRLAARILAEIIEDIRATENLPVILGGDFNEKLNTDVLTSLRQTPDLFALTADDAVSGAASYIGGSRKSLIDHIIVSKDIRLGDISGDDAAVVRLDKRIRDFSSAVSDHIPIVMRAVSRKAPLDSHDVSRSGAEKIGIPQGATSMRVSFEKE